MHIIYGFRSIAPSLCGSIYSWSLHNIKTREGNLSSFPVNQYFTFFMLSIFSVLNALFASRFNRSMDFKKIPLDVDPCNDSQAKRITRMTVSTFDYVAAT